MERHSHSASKDVNNGINAIVDEHHVVVDTSTVDTDKTTTVLTSTSQPTATTPINKRYSTAQKAFERQRKSVRTQALNIISKFDRSLGLNTVELETTTNDGDQGSSIIT
jgi:lipopolysaccharide export system protein LptC